jgi:hypothetical protein
MFNFTLVSNNASVTAGGAFILTAGVTLDYWPVSSLVVSLTSSDPTNVPVPASLTLSGTAGQAGAAYASTTVTVNALAPTENVIVTATMPAQDVLVSSGPHELEPLTVIEGPLSSKVVDAVCELSVTA